MGKALATFGPQFECGRSDVQNTIDTRFVERVVFHIVENREELFRIGAIQTQNPGMLAQGVRDAADEYYTRHETRSSSDKRDQYYYNFAEFVVLAGLAVPTVQTDWSVDRIEKAEESLGIRSFQELECVLAERYARPGDPRGPPGGKCLHMHKGSGDGTLCYFLRKGKRRRTDPDPTADHIAEDCIDRGTPHQRLRRDVWVEIGYGDRLYFSLQKLLLRFVRPDKADDPSVQHVVRVLSMIVAKELKNQWFEHAWDEESMIRNEQQKRGKRIDLNDIFKLLAQPQQWVQDSHLFARGKHLESVEFEFDTTAKLKMESEEQLLRWAGMSRKNIDHHLNEIRYREWTSILHSIEELQKISKKSTRGARKRGFHKHRTYLETNGSICEPKALAEIELACGMMTHQPDDCEKLRKQLTTAKDTLIADRQRLKHNDNAKRGVSDRRKHLAAVMHQLLMLEKLCVFPAPERDVPKDLCQVGKCLNTLKSAKDASEHASRIGLICAMLESFSSLHPLPWDDLGKAIAQTKPDVMEECRKKREAESGGDADTDYTEHPAAPLRDVFDDRFVDAVINNDRYDEPDYRKKSPPLDLNREGPEMHLHNFVQGMFTDLPEVFPENSFSLITAVRSDSHENDTDFRNDIERNIGLLRNGGVLLVDGIRQSLTRIQRLEEVQRITAANPDLRTEVVFDANTHEPKSLLIQRRFTSKKEKDPGYLTTDDKKRIFRDDTYSKPLQEVLMRRPDIDIATSVRKKLIVSIREKVRKGLIKTPDGRAGYEEIFFGNTHDRIDERVNRAITRMTASSLATKLHRFDSRLLESVRVALLKARRKAPAQRRAKYGRYVDGREERQEIPWSEDFYKNVNHVLQYFGADASDPEIREEYSRTLFGKMAERLPLYVHRDEKPKKLLGIGCNTEWHSNPELKHAAIQRIKATVLEEVEEILLAKFAQTERKNTPTNAERLLNHTAIHALPRKGMYEEGINKYSALSFGRTFPDNREFAAKEATDAFDRKVQELRDRLSFWRQNKAHQTAPIHLIRFADCPTNNCLLEQLQTIVGEDWKSFIDPLSISFDRNERAENRIRHNATVLRKLREDLDEGGVFVAGGSWYDAHDDYGEFYKEQIGMKLFDRLKEKHSHVRMLGICFGYQTMADILGKKMRMGDGGLRTLPGALEFCPSPLHHRGKHPLFADCPSKLTIMQTHSGHVCGLEQLINDAHINVLARSILTGQPIAYSAMGDRLLGIQAHPEVLVNSAEHRKRLITDLEGMNEGLHQVFGVGASHIESMWRHAAKHVQAEAGPHILVNGLLHLIRQLTPEFSKQ